MPQLFICEQPDPRCLTGSKKIVIRKTKGIELEIVNSNVH